MSKKVLFVAAHPDDETLGCGGAILKHKENNDEIIWLIVTRVTKDFGWSKNLILKRQKQISKVFSLYGFLNVHKLNYPTTTLDQIPENTFIMKINTIIQQEKPEIIYLPNRSDIHSDHRFTFNYFMSSIKSFNNPFIKNIFMYECISETEFAPALVENAFVPNYFIDISPYIDKKIEIMKVYESEIKEHPFPRNERNIRALATFRGAQCGVEYAEAFMLLKGIWK